ncbi:uncharacterized protein F5147DRAFT_651174 [Suillus discolor]|uniref:Uncharacterized protein n=1 Tax=Suillus discolor TaxID=1912936 RepID=A0A9P7F9H9_9AGAM|nr:uncharacterized protein F5147DRAFT_651174 [Suillus discolor]KAG2111492.1 hypothetical protein F5147DRAFT_651174 [Suillus discolor]
MSQPDTIMKCIGTQPKNATQHPEHILTEGHGKRCTTAQKAADNQHEREAKEMQADQDAACTDAPKSKCPHARPVGKAGNTLKTSNSTIDGGQAEVKIVTDKLVDTKGQGVGEKLTAGANVKHPASDEELEVLVATKPKKKRANKQVVRDAIKASGTIINGSTKAHDRDVGQKTSDV